MVAHVAPENPSAQEQLKEPTASTHDPPFKHGLLAQSSVSIEQSVPEYPGGQIVDVAVVLVVVVVVVVIAVVVG